MKKLTEKQLLIVTALLSLMISFWLSYSNDIISRDSTLYINIAQKYLDEGFIEAFKLWSWPFYAIFFAMLHQMTGLGLEYSAYLFSAILEAIICVVFVKIYCKIAFTEKHLWVAALFIITFTGFNAYRGDIIRGYGFWAFTLLAIYYYLSYYQAEKKIDAIKWQLSIFIATLFRPEAIVFAVAGPFFYVFLFAVPFKKRVLSFINLNSVNFVILAVILLAFTISSELRLFFSEHTPDQSVYFSLSFLLRNFNQGVENFIEHVLVFDYSAKYVKLILASGLTTMLIYKIILNLGIAYTALWSIGIYKKWLKLRTESWIILYFALIAFTVLMVLNITRFYVSSRYIVFLVILLGLVVSQYLDVLLVSLYRHKQKWLLWVDLDKELKIDVARMLEYEANRFINAEPRNQEYDNTGAEENAWNSHCTSLAFNMMPSHPNRDKWDKAAKTFMYNSFSVAEDLEDTNIGDDNKMIKEWVSTINAHPDYTVENHSRVHIGYLKNTLCMLLENALNYELMGNLRPARSWIVRTGSRRGAASPGHQYGNETPLTLAWAEPSI